MFIKKKISNTINQKLKMDLHSINSKKFYSFTTSDVQHFNNHQSKSEKIIDDFLDGKWNDFLQTLGDSLFQMNSTDFDEYNGLNECGLKCMIISQLKTLMNLTFSVLKGGIDDWASDRFKEIVEDSLNQSRYKSLPPSDLDFMEKKLRRYKVPLVNDILGRPFVQDAIPHAKIISKTMDEITLSDKFDPKAVRHGFQEEERNYPENP